MTSNSLFRERALRARDSGDALASSVSLAPSPKWLVLGALALLLVVVVVQGLTARVPIIVSGQGPVLPRTGLTEIVVFEPGVIERIHVSPGDAVEPGSAVAHMRTPDGRTVEIRPLTAGEIINLSTGVGSALDFGERVARMIPESDSQFALILVDSSQAAQLRVGMPVQISGVPDDAGVTVAEIEPQPTTMQELTAILGGDESVAGELMNGQLKRIVAVAIPNSVTTGQGWHAGEVVQATFVVGTRSFIEVPW